MSDSSRRIKGKIIRVVEARGFGFIEGDDKIDYFFHLKHVSKFSRPFRHFKAGDIVEFNPTQTETGPQAWEIMHTEEAVAPETVAQAIAL